MQDDWQSFLEHRGAELQNGIETIQDGTRRLYVSEPGIFILTDSKEVTI